MKKILILMVMVIVALGAEARTVRDFFVDEPNRLFMLLPRTTRLDMLDYYDSGQLVTRSNNLGDGSQMIKVDGNFMHVRMSASKTVQMLLIPDRKDSVIVVIETLETPVKDSHISFYDTQWRKLVNKYFTMPGLDAFFKKEVDKKQRAELLDAIPFPLVSLTMEGDDYTTIVARHGLKEFLVAEEYAPYEKAMVPSLTYTTKSRFWKLKK